MKIMGVTPCLNDTMICLFVSVFGLLPRVGVAFFFNFLIIKYCHLPDIPGHAEHGQYKTGGNSLFLASGKKS